MPSQPCSILVVDDDPAIREFLAELLTDEGYHVLTAVNGAAALALIDQQRPACLLLDLQMPVLDGWGVAAALRERGTHCPIIVMSAMLHGRERSAVIGAAGWLAKPFDMDELLTMLTSVLQSGTLMPLHPTRDHEAEADRESTG